MLARNPKHAILFTNLGGPENQEEVQAFLYRLFVDPEIIRIRSNFLRRALAWFISITRKKKSQRLYALLGGGSPIRKLTDLQSRSVELLLNAAQRSVTVRTAFTCSNPLIEDVVKELAASGTERFLTFPLYPQYSLTTTKGSLDSVRNAVQLFAPQTQLFEMGSWPTHPLFLQAHAELVRKAVAEFSHPYDEEIHLLFSAHSIPEKLVTKDGDPYKREVEQSVQGVLKKAEWKGPWSLGWQSKLGPVKWLEPSTESLICSLGQKGVKQILIVPIAFVTDHVETLVEIDMEYKEIALHNGVKEFIRTPGLNDHGTFIRALVDLAQSRQDFWNS